VQRATAQSKTGFFRDCGVAEAPPGFQAGWSDCVYFFLFLFVLFAYLEFPCNFCTRKGMLPYRSSAQMPCREEVGILFAALGIFETQTARYGFRSTVITHHLKNAVGRS
jgi:hypothetical protein